MVQIKCPTCGCGGIIDIVRGIEGNPIKMFKCTQCGREFKERSTDEKDSK
jgi:DNA-directed RNA polymerase subunit RPC12/RpoP